MGRKGKLNFPKTLGEPASETQQNSKIPIPGPATPPEKLMANNFMAHRSAKIIENVSWHVLLYAHAMYSGHIYLARFAIKVMQTIYNLYIHVHSNIFTADKQLILGLDEYISNFSAYYTIIIKQVKDTNKFWKSKKKLQILLLTVCESIYFIK